jgi:hypothetical protein
VKVERCRSCGAPIIWATATTGRAMPIDRDRIAGGNIELEEPPAFTPEGRRPESPTARVVMPAPGVWRYRSHFATCPDAWRWKRR